MSSSRMCWSFDYLAPGRDVTRRHRLGAGSIIESFARPAKRAVLPISHAAASGRRRARGVELRRHEIDEGADFRRQMPSRRIDEPDRRRLRLEPVEHRDELAARNIAVEIIL